MFNNLKLIIMRKSISVSEVKVDDREILSSRVINAALLAEVLSPELEKAGYKIREENYGEPCIKFRNVRVAERYLLSCRDLEYSGSFFSGTLNLWAVYLEKEVPGARPQMSEEGEILSPLPKEQFIGCYEMFSGKVVIVTEEVMEIVPVAVTAEIIHELRSGKYTPRDNEISPMKNDAQIILYYLYRRFVFNAEREELTVKSDCSREDTVILDVRCLKGKEKVWDAMYFLYNDYRFMKDPA